MKIFKRTLALTTALGLGVSFAHAQNVDVRSAEHEGYSRLVFDFETQVDYELSRDGEDLRLVFQTSDLPIIEESDINKLSRVIAAEAQLEEGRSVIRLTLSSDVETRAFRVGPKIALDVKNNLPLSVPVDEVERTALTLATATEAMNAADVAMAEAERAAREKQRQETLEAARRTLQGAIGGEEESARPIEIETSGEQLSLIFPVGLDVPAASFFRAGRLWVLFDQDISFEDLAIDHPAVQQVSLVKGKVSGLQLVLNDDFHGQIQQDDNHWVLSVSQQPTRVAVPLFPVRHGDEGGGEKSFVEMVYQPILKSIIDQSVGDELIIALTVKSGEGIADALQSADYTLLPTLQGVVVERHSDDVRVRLLENGLSIDVERPQRLAALLPEAPKHYLELDVWRDLHGASSYDERRKSLLYTLSMASDEEREAARMELAKFYTAYDNHALAFGVLQLMEEDNANLHQDPGFRALRGVVQFHLRRFEAAATDLSVKDLALEADASLWRALVFDAQNRFAEAMQNYRLGIPALGHYSGNDRARFSLAAARAAIAVGEYGIAEREITKLKGVSLNPMRASEASFIEAELARIYQDVPTALDIYDNLANAAPRPVAARARLASIKTRQQEGVLNPAKAIQDLEALRYAWRGDVFEIELLKELGRLHVLQGDYRMGLEIMRQAVSYFEKSEATKAVTRQMEALFQDLYLKGKAEELEPIQAVALYYDFRELTPLGRDGDTMVRRLVDRMVSVDLLDRAAGLLEHQIKFRLEGVAQASVAARLAAILIKDQRPDKAIDIIRATRNVAEMPVDLLRERTLLEARAMIDLGRYGEAAAMLEDDQSRDAHLLRADLYWGDKNWASIIDNTDHLLGNRWRDDAALTIDEQRQILRTAVAYTMLEQEDGLNVLRRRYDLAMAAGPFGNAFSVITGSGVASPSNLRAAVSNLADVDRLESFMDKYRVNEAQDL